MRKYVLTLISLLLFSSCDQEENQFSSQLCGDGYFYYSGSSKNYFKHSLYEVWIVLDQTDMNREEARSILEKYSFLDTGNFSFGSNYGSFKVMIDGKVDCTDFKNYLIALNQDPQIYSATPVFYFSDDNPLSYCVLLSEVLTKNNDEVISESDFINFAKTFNLELIDSKFSTQHFKVKEVKTGFEALEIANEIYESGKIQYSHPNFIAHVVLH
ncbi:hypothetical protein KZP23_13045 [Echinicola marina]|uniref:hypothetical protein n=1 Tax=Echinicola marina TaxID=2859768 RepID=UPI001CF610A8|nr:hypothetical protein [Echinicola marina]UCS91675.1 hypothetical protein KZP23_13045 [Echinicola marina]